MEDEEEYAAVSYTWDNQALDREVVGERETLLVTISCHKVLVRLRAMGWATVRIHQLCIDQRPSSLAERDKQITLMNSVYTGALPVFV